ncbi:TonB-dependent receptor [Henriciella aquimarina]|uniref:TonB-dependent receptor n=1 Tax=Henriciella aquimarina TaxID=545261 RepID=UPI000A013912|nr:TonB-dependent receptor [Henriciella aquimarina]
MKTIDRLPLMAGAASSLVLSMAAPALAQETGQEDGRNRVLQTVQVTAERREASQQDVPVTVATVDERMLSEGDYRTSEDLAQQVPGLQIKSSFSASNPTIFIRGVGINDFNPANSGAIGVMVDDMFYNSTTGQLFQLFDLDRVEVLKGPQGTLYGRNTTGGVLSVYTKEPGFEPGGYVSATYGRFNQLDLEGAVTLPVSDKLAFRVSGVSNTRDGTRDIAFPDGTSTEKNDVDFQAARLQMLFEPTSALKILGKIEYGKSSATSRSYESQGLINYSNGQYGLADYDGVCGGRGAAVCGDAFGYVDDPDPYSGAENLKDTPEEVEAFTANLQVEWDLGSFELTSVTGYLDTDREAILEVDASPNRLVEEYINDGSEQFSQEVRLASQWEGPMSLIMGAFYLQDELTGQDSFELLAGANPTPGTPYFDAVNFILRTDRFYTQKTDTFAVFAQSDYELTDRLTATLGARFTWEDRELDHVAYAGPVDAVPLDGDMPVYARLLDTSSFETDKLTFEEPTFRAALSYDVSDDVMLFGSVSRGFKSGGFNTGATSDPIEASVVKPEKLMAYEVGIKSEWFDRTLRANASAFYYDYTDLQVFGLAPGAVPTQTLFNADEAEIKGLEFDLTAVPASGLELSLAGTYLDAEYTDFVTPIGQDFSGNTMVAAPEWSLVARGRYETGPIWGDLGLVASADATYTGDQYFDTQNTARLGQDAYWLANARLALRPQGGRWELAAFVKNLADEEYLVDAFDVSDFGFDELVYGDPRTYGISLTYRFGSG